MVIKQTRIQSSSYFSSATVGKPIRIKVENVELKDIKLPQEMERVIAKPLGWFSNTKPAKYAGKQVFDNNRAFIDGLGVTSIIAKDGLGCYLYVTQSLNNKDIPDDKRSFVASLDLTNGVLMIALQLLMFFTVSHKVCQTKMFDKFFGKMFDRPIKKAYYTIAKNQENFAGLDSIKFANEFEKVRIFKS